MISIVYVYYNSYDVIKDSIISVLNNNVNTEIEIIVVVNRCDEQKAERLQNLSKKIKIIYNKSKNKGFGYANNLGAQQAKGEYLLILNPDTILQTNVLASMKKIMDENNNIGASICKLTDEKGNIQKTVMRLKYNLATIIIQHYFLHTIPLINLLFKKHYYYEPYYTIPQYPETISGAFMFFRKSVYDNLGGFDENYFMYSEDNDLSIRTKKIAELYYTPEVTTIHIGGTTLGKAKSLENLKIFYSSLFYFVNKFYGKQKLTALKILLKINAVVLYPFIRFVKNENLRITLKNRTKLFLQMPVSSKNV